MEGKQFFKLFSYRGSRNSFLYHHAQIVNDPLMYPLFENAKYNFQKCMNKVELEARVEL